LYLSRVDHQRSGIPIYFVWLLGSERSRKRFRVFRKYKEVPCANSPLGCHPKRPVGVNCIFCEYLRGYAVQPERRHVDGDDFAESGGAHNNGAPRTSISGSPIPLKSGQFRLPSRPVGLLFRPFTHKALLRSEIEQAPFKGAETKGGRSGQ
jgi:hypothetical protein